jgi:hypothetical protein
MFHTELWAGQLMDELSALEHSLRASSGVKLNELLNAIPEGERTHRRHYDALVNLCSTSEVVRSDVFDLLWNYDNRKSHSFAFWASAALFAVGFLLMASVFVESFCTVVSVVA